MNGTASKWPFHRLSLAWLAWVPLLLVACALLGMAASVPRSVMIAVAPAWWSLRLLATFVAIGHWVHISASNRVLPALARGAEATTGSLLLIALAAWGAGMDWTAVVAFGPAAVVVAVPVIAFQGALPHVLLAGDRPFGHPGPAPESSERRFATLLRFLSASVMVGWVADVVAISCATQSDGTNSVAPIVNLLGLLVALTFLVGHFLRPETQKRWVTLATLVTCWLAATAVPWIGTTPRLVGLQLAAACGVFVAAFALRPRIRQG